MGDIATDIPQDFVIVPAGFEFDGFLYPGAFAEIPAGASFLIVGGYDSFYGDNGDANGDFGLEITSGFLPVTQIPLPLPAWLLASALIGLATTGRRRGA